MKTVLFFRHGKSNWGAEYAHDAERPLKKRGRRAAEGMGRFLAEAGQTPDLVLASSAVRARDTARLAAETGGWRASVQVEEALYESTPDRLLGRIRQAPDAAGRLMLVGHEPTWSETVGRLIGQAQIRFPTAAMARVDFEVETWAEIAFGGGMLIWLMPPRLLENEQEGE